MVDRSPVSGEDLCKVRHDLEAARDWILGRSPGANWPTLDEEALRRYEAGQGRRTL
ncbi:hypothetical protein [Streptomyces sp. AS58]|uniref:hypothetical protein n=1 Tax=Streptomyces sp. AS58 TaxID=1519489 RepID=UPI000A5DF011|nr:hypothetical protein [Streptomyces sp. AS58]